MSRLPLAPGWSVLDLCCGHGASAIPAARAVGATGRVLGVDVAESLLELALARAAGEGLANVDFRQGDATCTGLPAGCFDAVICVFGVFFAADMEAFIAEMWRLLPARVQAASGRHFLADPDSFWDIVLGSGYRATVDALSPEQCISVRARLLGQLRSSAVTTVRTDVAFGTAQKSS